MAADNKKRIIILDDDFKANLADTKYLFKNAGFDSEVYIATSLEEVMKKLKTWAAEGHPADLIDSDVLLNQLGDVPDYHHNMVNGMFALQYIIDWAKSQPESVRPKKYFMHSLQTDSVYGIVDLLEDDAGMEIGVHELAEFEDIVNLGRGDKHASLNPLQHQSLMDYLNTAFGAHYPITPEAVKALHHPKSPEAKTTDDKKRILIFDDDLSAKIETEHLFQNAGFDVEVCLATEQEQAMQKLKQWAAEGHAADIVDADFFSPGIRDGTGFMQSVMDWAASQPSHLKPKQYFMHSNSPDDLQDRIENHYIVHSNSPELNERMAGWNTMKTYDVTELYDISHVGEGDPYACWMGHSKTLRSYLNETFGARYALDKEEAKTMKKTAESGKSPANGAGDKKRILILDDDIHLEIETKYLFKNAGINAEVCIATTPEDAMRKLKTWAGEGHPADIVNIDFLLGYGGQECGLEELENIVEWAKSLPEALQPRKYFIHSRNTENLHTNVNMAARRLGLKEPIGLHNTVELVDISNLGRGDEHATHRELSWQFREYLNKTLGTRYPLSPAQVSLLAKPAETRLDAMQAYEEVTQGTIDPQKALTLIDLTTLASAFKNHIDEHKAEAGRGYNLDVDQVRFMHGTGGAMSGHIAFSAEAARELKKQGKKAILVLQEFEPKDTASLSGVDGIILLGGGSEHLNVVVANCGIPAVMDNESGFGTKLAIEPAQGKKRLVNKANDEEMLAAGSITIEEGEAVTLGNDGNGLGQLYKGILPIVKGNPYAAEFFGEMYPKIFPTVTRWADEARAKHGGMKVKANADNPEQVKKAIELGAEGVGLLRTEHMFFADERRRALAQALLAEEVAARESALSQLKEFQKNDFTEIFAAAAKAGREFPVTIRLLDAPPQEFLEAGQVNALEKRVGKENMRASQLALKTPGLYAMQAAAIFEAAQDVGFKGPIDIMVPLVRTPEETRALKEEIAQVAAQHGMQGQYKFRAMIETFKSVKNAGEIAKLADGLSFGTNDLTAESMKGAERNDVVATRAWQVKHHHVGKSPFLRLSKPVEAMIKAVVKAARQTNPKIDISICGHQMADVATSSIGICQQLGLDSFSVPAGEEYLIPARIAAGQAALTHPQNAVMPSSMQLSGR